MLKPLTYNICSVVRTDDIDIGLSLSKCKRKIFSLDFMPLFAHCKNPGNQFIALHGDLETTYLLYYFGSITKLEYKQNSPAHMYYDSLQFKCYTVGYFEFKKVQKVTTFC